MITEEVQKLCPSGDVHLFEVDAVALGVGTIRFHGYARAGSIWWQGNEFSPWPIEADGFARTSDRPPNPTLTVGNLDGSISALCAFHEDMVGAKVTRHRTLIKYLDAVNFPASYGPEMVTNNTFTDMTGWTQQSGTVAATGGVLRCTRAGGSLGRGRYPLTCVIGQQYEVKFTRIAGTSTGTETASVTISATSAAGSVVQQIGGFGPFTMVFTATQTSHWIMLDSGTGVNGNYCDYDNVYCKSLTGGNPDADPDEHFVPEVWYIERKIGEEDDKVSFELSGYDFNGMKLPARVIIPNQCPWGYRSGECGYTGPPVATIDDTPTSNPALDRCSKKISGCKKRFGEKGVLNHGGFPAAGLMRS